MRVRPAGADLLRAACRNRSSETFQSNRSLALSDDVHLNIDPAAKALTSFDVDASA